MKRACKWFLVALATFVVAGHVALAQTAGAAPDPTAAANAYVEAPHAWQLWFPKAGSPMQAQVDWLMKYVLWIMTAIVAFVGVLMAYVLTSFRASKHPVPTRTTHNTLIEVIWIAIPVMILAIIIIPSINLIYYMADDSNPYMTVTVTGHQWYWEYNYNAVPGLDYTSYMIPDDKLQPGEIRRLSVDHPLVLPVGAKVKFDITSGDVLHSFFLPALGVQKYAIPGNIQNSWTIIERPGTYYGQCNQICGLNHDAMPIEIKAIPMKDYLAWTKYAQANYTMNTVPARPLSSPMPVDQYASLGAAK